MTRWSMIWGHTGIYIGYFSTRGESKKYGIHRSSFWYGISHRSCDMRDSLKKLWDSLSSLNMHNSDCSKCHLYQNISQRTKKTHSYRRNRSYTFSFFTKNYHSISDIIWFSACFCINSVYLESVLCRQICIRCGTHRIYDGSRREYSRNLSDFLYQIYSKILFRNTDDQRSISPVVYWVYSFRDEYECSRDISFNWNISSWDGYVTASNQCHHSKKCRERSRKSHGIQYLYPERWKYILTASCWTSLYKTGHSASVFCFSRDIWSPVFDIIFGKTTKISCFYTNHEYILSTL